MKLLILAGGFGTRLAEKINNLPKSLAPINGKPFLFYLIKSYLNQGITDFTFLLHYKSELIIEFLEISCFNKNGNFLRHKFQVQVHGPCKLLITGG